MIKTEGESIAEEINSGYHKGRMLGALQISNDHTESSMLLDFNVQMLPGAYMP